ncbi:MAG: GAF domain-containing protein, partial [Candidatus Omnitrophica bacterium]|nr:GAF domain-containing protein [Candidatus Omnitrophota bacterium]
MNPYAIPPLLSTILIGWMGLFVYIRNRKSKLNITFSLFCLSLVVWLAGFTGVYASRDEVSALWWGRTGFMGVSLIPPTMYHFVITFLRMQQRRLLTVLYLSSVAGLAISRTNLVYKGIWTGFWGYYPIAGPLYPIFPLTFSCCFVGGVVLLFLALRKESEPLRRQQIKYVMVAFACGTPGLVDYIVKYQVHVYPFGYITALALISWIAYAIARHRLMDVNLALMRTAVFIAVYTFALGLPLFLAVSWRPQLEQLFGINWWIWLWVVCALLATAAHYANQYFQRRTEARILAKQREYQDFLVMAAAGMLRILDLPQLLKLIVRIVTSRVKLTYAALYLQEDGEEPKGPYLLKVAHGRHSELPSSVETNDPFIHYLSVDQLSIVSDEVRRLVREGKEARLVSVSRRLSSLKAAVAVPSFLKNRLIGFLILGEKLSGQVFTNDDLRVFDNLAHQTAIAIQNARFHRKGVNLGKLEAADEQLSAIGHEMGNVLHIGVVQVGVLCSNLEGSLAVPPKEKLVENLRRVEKTLLRGHDVIDDLKEYRKTSDQPGIHAFPLAQFIE